ncbi:DUF3854 domain-containing protein [Tolypothrix sp. LEGE 11397]|nr:DUF3854 domain-containing protein [Tolypothrix sp. LEGE 11397]UYD30109.1 DUF3854 domain-containing protein [Tolypothrix sp. PCC 7712]UYD37961.1 DUF3854 domain-containing protein [Tolypothrix sp. PCC 7601]
MDVKEAGERLGYTAKSAGIWLEGYNGFGQFRPNKPWKDEDDKEGKKAPKYRTATKEDYDAMLPHNPHNSRYWADLEALKQLCWSINGYPCLGITEGLFKAIAACSNDIPCVALAGVEQGLTSAKKDVQGKRYLVEALEMLARAGFGFIILFDADARTNKGVVQAQRKLANQLAKFNVPVYIGTGLWSVDQGKGMDEYIQNNGADQFKREVMGKVVDFASWEKQFKEENDQEGDRITQAVFIRQFAENYRARLSWNVPAKAWYWYEAKNKAGVWGEIPGEEAMDIVMTELEALGVDFSSNFVAGVITMLKAKLRVNDWEVASGLVCLEDCVIDIRTLEVKEHQPGYRFLSRLPFKWSDREVGCEPIKQWLLETCGNHMDWVEVIRAGMNATITERGGELQRYMELIGAGGTGKGTILRLVQSLLGKDNYAVTNLKELEQNRFESAKFYGKKAIFITDSERYAGDVSRLKAITGDDEIPIEKKGVQQTGNYRFPGVVWVAANEAIQSSDYTNALSRRRLSMSFERVIPPHQRRDLMEEFKPYLPGLLFWVLSMVADEVADYVRNTAKRVPSLGSFSAEVLLETNPLANWADQHLYYDPNTETKIGDATGEAGYCLYANYSQWASANGQGTMTTQRFSTNLLNLLRTQLGIDANKRKTNRGRFITMIGIRQPGHDFPPLISGVSDDPVKMLVTAETLASYDTQQSDDLFNSSYSNQSATNTTCLQSIEGVEDGNNGHFAPTSSPVRVSGRHQDGTESSPNHSQVVTNQPETVMVATNQNAQTLTSDDTQPISKQIIANWNDSQALGKIILAIADTEQLRQEVRFYSPEQLKHIKDAANEAWKPGCNSHGEYCGDKVELMEFGQQRDWRVRALGGGSIVSAARGNVSPWLGV